MALVSYQGSYAGAAVCGLTELNSAELIYEAEGGLSIPETTTVHYVDPYMASASGEITLSGDVSPSVVVIPVCEGLAFIQGSTPVALEVTDIEAGGSAALGGAGLYELVLSYTASGGMNASGEAPVSLEVTDVDAGGSASVGGAGLYELVLSYTGSGVVSASGTAPVSLDLIVIDAGGIAETDGEVYLLLDISADAGGSITASGAAGFSASYTGTASGEIECDGSTPFSVGYVPIIGGSIDTYGEADVSITYVDALSGGGIAAAGAAPFSVGYEGNAGGAAVATGTAEPFQLGCNGNAGGAMVMSGLSSQAAAYIEVANQGGASVGGEAIVRLVIDVSGFPRHLRTFDGDIRLKITEDGGIITIWGGQPEMDAGLETAVHISLFSEYGWWGNAIAPADEQIGSGFEEALRASLTNQARLDVEEQARQALSWMLETGIAKSITVSATIPARNTLGITISIEQPDRAPELFRYSINWQEQRIHMEAAA